MEEKKIKEVVVAVPKGKRAEWQDVNGVTTLVLVDEAPAKDERPITERIKTFDDAMNDLGKEHPLVEEYLKVYYAIYDSATNTSALSPDVIAYFKARIIVAALNEGWEPQFTEDEWRYAPYFQLYTQEKIDDMDDDEKSKLLFVGGSANGGAQCGVSYAVSNGAFSDSGTNVGARLAFKSAELAEYAGRQFIDIWSPLVFKTVEIKK